MVTPVQAQDNLRMIIETECSTITSLRSYLQNEHGEIAFTSAPGVFKRWDGELSVGLFRTYLNPETFTFTLTVEFIEDNVACIIAMGDEFAPVIQDGTAL
jgi:hypothetical protein